MAVARARAGAGTRARAGAREAVIPVIAPLTDPVSLALTGLAAMLGVAIVWVQWPRPPALDGQRWFKTLLVALLRGRSEADGSSVDAFEDTVVRFVPYHPAGRFPERKVTKPDLAIADEALEGERALIEALAARATVPERWAYLYDEDEIGLAARLSDPTELGETYDPATVLVPEADWEAVAAWGADPTSERAMVLVDALARSLPARWVLIAGRPGPPSVLEALAEELGERATRLEGTAEPEVLHDALVALANEAPGGLVLIGEEVGVARLLDVLARDALVREQTLAVVSVGGVIGGRSDEADGPWSLMTRRDWMQAHFRIRDLETDVVRLTPYFSLQWLDRTLDEPGIEGLPLASMRFPEPDATRSSVATMEVVDLGPLPVDPDLPLDLVARALVVCVTAWVAHRR